MLGTAVLLRLLGRVWWCECGQWFVASWDIWSRHNSQHLIDPYFFSHVLHGILFFPLLAFWSNKLSLSVRYRLVMLIEAFWEVLENSPFIIERYREGTIALSYFGDSIANSMFDLLACCLGFVLAAKLRPWQSVAVFITTEVIMLLAIRDNLFLNVLMLIAPLDIIREWQMSAGIATP